MVTIIKRGSTREEVMTQLQQHDNNRVNEGVNLQKYIGTITLKEDPLKLQEKWRDEWE